ncbi:hypothetical protein GIB67_021314 [Kingdonia uniflora]|uniref:Transposase n=1 Tax=Kingdonia uniflora TaxID=39325 RepID=A0A7J7LY78_9MAGN|nr:hypothetical protein GIB67_021314 [Kingdonia uniflora]
MLYDSDDDVIILDEDMGENAGVNDGVGVDVGGGGGINQTGMNNWVEIDLDNLNAKEGYYSTHTSLDADEGPTQEDIEVDVEFANFAQETENIFANEENDVNIGNLHQLVEDLVPEMEWPIVHTARAYIKRFIDDGYVVQPELCRQILSTNPGSLARSSKDVKTNMWMGICVAYKASFNRLANGCRPILGLDGSFLKGKYGGVCLSIIGLDANNGLFPIAVDRHKGLIGAIAEVFPNANHRFCFRHMYKNMKKYYRGIHLEGLVWGAAKAWKQTEKHEKLDKRKVDNPKAHVWFSARAEEHITKMETFYGQYHPEGAGDGCHVAIGANVSVLMKLKVSWIEYCSPYHRVSLNVETYKNAIYSIVDPSDWGKPINDFLPPPLVRGSGRPRKVRIPDPDEALGPQKKCGKCGGFGHNKKTCKGDPTPPKPKITRGRQRVDTHSSRAEHRRNTNQPPATPNVGGRGGTRGRGRSISTRSGRSGGIFTHMNNFGGGIGIRIDLFGEGSTRVGTRGGRGGANRGPNVGGNVGPSANRGGTTGDGTTTTFNP